MSSMSTRIDPREAHLSVRSEQQLVEVVALVTQQVSERLTVGKVLELHDP